MFRNRITRLAIASAVLCPGAARADELVLDYQTTIKLAAERAPVGVAARGRIDEARGLRAGAGVRPNPEIGVSAGPRFRDDTRRTDVEASLDIPLELGGRRDARLDVADAEIAGVTAEADDVTRQVIREAGLAYYRALAAEQRGRIATDVEAVALEISTATEKRLAKGDALELDTSLAKAALGRARAATHAAEADREAALGELRALLAVDPDDTIVLKGDLAARRVFDLDALVGTAQKRPDVVQLDAEQRVGTAQVRLGRSFGWPEVRIGVSYGREEDAQLILGGITLALPLFDRGQEQRQVGRAKIARAGAEKQALTASIDARLRAAVATYNKRIEAVDEFETNVNPLLDETDRQLRKAYDAGQRTLTDYLVARRELLDSRVEYVQRLLEAAEAAVEVDATAGVQP